MPSEIELFKILSDETRLRILLLLSCKELCVCEISDLLDEPQPKISRHLSRLRDRDFVKDERQGQWIFYTLNVQNELIRIIFEQLLENSAHYPMIQKDKEKLQKKILDGKMCCRSCKK